MKAPFGWLIVYMVLLADHRPVKTTISFEKLRAGPNCFAAVCALRAPSFELEDPLNTENICSM
jgi:hypothetical protein